MTRQSKAIAGSVVALVAAGIGIAAFLVKESSDRSQCKNNLMQIGLALWNYDSAYGNFPPGTMVNSALPPEKRLSWLVSILPFLEGGGPWLFDYDKAWDKGRNRLVMRGEKFSDRIHLTEDKRLFRCPAGHPSVDSAGQGLSNYVAIAGLGADVPDLQTSNRRAGVFGYERTTTRDQIKDGLSSTMSVIETSIGIGPWKAGGPAGVRGVDPTRQPYIARNGQFGGTHRGGCMVLFADGSARFVRDTIDPTVFECSQPSRVAKSFLRNGTSSACLSPGRLETPRSLARRRAAWSVKNSDGQSLARYNA